jgi:hypothetical protein
MFEFENAQAVDRISKQIYTDRQKKWDIKKIHLYLSMYVIFLSQKFIFVLFPILHNFLLIYWVLPFNC